MSIPNFSSSTNSSQVLEILYKKYNNLGYSQKGKQLQNEIVSRPNVYASQLLSNDIPLPAPLSSSFGTISDNNNSDGTIYKIQSTSSSYVNKYSNLLLTSDNASTYYSLNGTLFKDIIYNPINFYDIQIYRDSSSNNITNVSCVEISNMLNTNKYLTELYLDWN